MSLVGSLSPAAADMIWPANWTDRITPEFRLAALCGLFPAPSNEIAPLLGANRHVPLDWTNFLRIVRRHRISGLACRALGDYRGAGVPTAVLDQLRRHSTHMAVNNLKLLAEAARVDRLLRDAGIEAAFLKGLPLGMRLHGDIGLRHCRDLDLLVTRESVPAARRLLLDAGYCQENPPPSVSNAQMEHWYGIDKDIEFRHAESGIILELHWRLASNDALMPPPAPSSWCVVETGGQIGLPALSVCDQFDYLVLHGARHAWSRLKWLADVGTILAAMPDAELSAMLQRAGATGTRRPTYQALILCALLFGLPLPAPVAAELVRSPVLRGLVAFALAEMTHGQGQADRTLRWYGSGLQSVYHYFLKSGWRYWSSEVRRDLVHPADWASIRLPQFLSGLYWALRLPLWLGRKFFRWK